MPDQARAHGSAPVLVTGGTGMLGRALREFLPRAVYLSGSDHDLRDLSETMAVFRTWKPASVVHLAARVGGVKENAAHNVEFLVDNIQINTNVLHAAAVHGVHRLITTLSTCCYPFFPDRATTEEDIHSGLPYDGNLGYGYAKRALDVHVRLANRQLGVRWQAITPVTMYGPHDNFSPEDGHVVGALIAKAVQAAESGGAVDVWGDGSAVRQFVYAPDVARVIVRLLDRDDTDGLIVAPDAGVTIRELAETVAAAAGDASRSDGPPRYPLAISEAMGGDGGGSCSRAPLGAPSGFAGTGVNSCPLRFDPTQPSGMLRKEMSGARFKARFPEFSSPPDAFTRLAEGIAKTVAWYKSRPQHVEEVNA